MQKAVALTVLCAAMMVAAQQMEPMVNPDSSNLHNMDLQSVVNKFNPKFVVVHDQDGVNHEMPSGVHAALVKSLISDFHGADIPVVYAQKRDILMN